MSEMDPREHHQRRYPPRARRRFDDEAQDAAFHREEWEDSYLPVSDDAGYDTSAYGYVPLEEPEPVSEGDLLDGTENYDGYYDDVLEADAYAEAPSAGGYEPGGVEAVYERTRPHLDRQAPPPRRNAHRRKQRRRRTAVLLGVAALVLILAAVSVHYLGGIRQLVSGAADYDGKGSGEVTVTIPEGASGRDIAQILHKEDVVASAQAFENAFSGSSLAKGIQAGTYTLHKKMAASEALAMLLNPASKADLTITIPEGFTVKQVHDRLVSVGNFSDAEVEAAMKDTTAIGLPAEANGNVEGWLAPDTYTIGPSDKPADLLKQMVSLTISRLDKAGVAAADREKVLIKGSIIEREVNKDEYYPKVARVVENRLAGDSQTHGLLQMDSTVLYGVGQTGGIPSPEQLKQDTPYNTYLHKGLPPTPIGAVGLKAIEAVVHPAEGNWLYYVTVNLETGETKFASTLAEHDANAKELRRYCADNPTVCK